MATNIPSRLFLFSALLIFLVNLLITNDFTTIWNEAEALNLLAVQEGGEAMSTIAPFSGFCLSLIYKSVGLHLFALRLPAILFLLLCLGIAYQVGHKVFGRSSLMHAGLLLFSSLLVANFAKFAISDTYLLGVQLLSFVFLIRYLKQINNYWQWCFWGTIVLGLLIEPLSILIWGIALWAFLYFMHPNGKELKRSYNWLLLVALAGLGIWSEYLSWPLNGFVLGYGHAGFGTYVLMILAGLIPLLGFLPAALWDTIQKFRKKEELSIIVMACLVAGALSQSMMLEVALVFIIAKQMMAFLDPRYPYQGLVKSISLIVLVMAFCVACLLMLSGFQQLGAVGFRSAMSIGAVYWVLGFAAVMGLFIKSERVIWGGFVWSGLLLSLLFWIQINPFLEEARNLPRQIVAQSRQMGATENTWLAVDTTRIAIRPNLKVYAREYLAGIKPYEQGDTTHLSQLTQTPIKLLCLLDSTGLVQLKTRITPDTVVQLSNRKSIWGGEEKYWLVQSGSSAINHKQ